jgi:hopanoid biosynthesis associated protein HpnK
MQHGRNDTHSGREVIFTADDFGLSESVNEAVELAHREGVLGAASLMVSGAAAGDAVRRARAMPSLAVGLHLVVIEGPAVLPPQRIPDLLDQAGRFPSDQLGLGINYFFRPHVRAQLKAEIRAQFEAFAATGLRLDHLNAHKHMHLHPTVGRLAIEIGRDYGLRAVRIPAEPPAVLARCAAAAGVGDRMLYRWAGILRRRARRAGLRVNDACFGLKWTGHMTVDRLLRLLPELPQGLSEIYAHPAAAADPALAALMPDYEQTAELDALLDPDVAETARRCAVLRAGYAAVGSS